MEDYNLQEDNIFENAYLVYKSQIDIGTIGWIAGLGVALYGQYSGNDNLIGNGLKLNDVGFAMMSTGFALGFAHLGPNRLFRMFRGRGLEEIFDPEKKE